MVLKKLCSKCRKIIQYGKARCEVCEAKHQARMKNYNDKAKKEYYKKYNSEKRENQDFYNSKGWNLTRQQINNRDRGLCRLCYSEGKIIYSDCIHHIEEVKENVELRCDDSNLISLCNRCHREVHLLYKSKSSIIKEKLKDIVRENI